MIFKYKYDINIFVTFPLFSLYLSFDLCFVFICLSFEKISIDIGKLLKNKLRYKKLNH